MNKSLFQEAEAYMERHWYDKDFGDMNDPNSAVSDFQRLQSYHKGSQLWQDLLLIVIENLERKYKYMKKGKTDE